MISLLNVAGPPQRAHTHTHAHSFLPFFPYSFWTWGSEVLNYSPVITRLMSRGIKKHDHRLAWYSFNFLPTQSPSKWDFLPSNDAQVKSWTWVALTTVSKLLRIWQWCGNKTKNHQTMPAPSPPWPRVTHLCISAGTPPFPVGWARGRQHKRAHLERNDSFVK